MGLRPAQGAVPTVLVPEFQKNIIPDPKRLDDSEVIMLGEEGLMLKVIVDFNTLMRNQKHAQINTQYENAEIANQLKVGLKVLLSEPEGVLEFYMTV